MSGLLGKMWGRRSTAQNYVIWTRVNRSFWHCSVHKNPNIENEDSVDSWYFDSDARVSGKLSPSEEVGNSGSQPVWKLSMSIPPIPWLTMSTTTTPKISCQSFFIHIPHHLSIRPVHITLTQLLPSTSFLLHVTTNPKQPRLSDVLVVSMPRGDDVLSSRLEGHGGLEEDIDRLSRLLGSKNHIMLTDSEAIESSVFRCRWPWRNSERSERGSCTHNLSCHTRDITCLDSVWNQDENKVDVAGILWTPPPFCALIHEEADT